MAAYCEIYDDIKITYCLKYDSGLDPVTPHLGPILNTLQLLTIWGAIRKTGFN